MGIHYLDGWRSYLRCGCCALIFVPAHEHLSREAERAEYDRHCNTVADPRYRRFLSRLAEPLMARLPPKAYGLDFGCGPGPALAAMLEEAGHAVRLYDLFYAPDESVWKGCYQFITASEVVEHLARPGEVLARLWARLWPTGVLAIMTQRAGAGERFLTWHYVRDPTHVAFFSEESFRWLAEQWGAELVFPSKDVALLVKP